MDTAQFLTTLKKAVREIVREELDFALSKMLKEIKQPTVASSISEQSVTKVDPALADAERRKLKESLGLADVPITPSVKSSTIASSGDMIKSMLEQTKQEGNWRAFKVHGE